MTSTWTTLAISVLASATLAGASPAEICQGFGPQTPRNIDNKAGENRRIFSIAPEYPKLNLCDIHFHKQAEHKALNYSLPAGDGKFGGYRCNATTDLELPELSPLLENHCTNVAAGDTVEVHWAYTSCDVEPGPTLGSCFSESCTNPNLRVESQVFLLVNDSSARDVADFANFTYGGEVDGYHQAKSIPSKTGKPVEFLGSTTGPSYTNEKCSVPQVSWSVRPRCAKLDIGSLSQWCRDNIFDEHAAHGVRQLVVDPKLLSKIE